MLIHTIPGYMPFCIPHTLPGRVWGYVGYGASKDTSNARVFEGIIRYSEYSHGHSMVHGIQRVFEKYSGLTRGKYPCVFHVFHIGIPQSISYFSLSKYKVIPKSKSTFKVSIYNITESFRKRKQKAAERTLFYSTHIHHVIYNGFIPYNNIRLRHIIDIGIMAHTSSSYQSSDIISWHNLLLLRGLNFRVFWTRDPM